MARRTSKQWAQLVDEHDRSQLSTKEFARRRGLNVKSLQFWRWKLRQGRGKKSVKRTAKAPVKSRSVGPKSASTVRLLPVGMVAAATSSSASGRAHAGRASITLTAGGDVRIDVALDVDPRDVARLVAALSGVAC